MNSDIVNCILLSFSVTFCIALVPEAAVFIFIAIALYFINHLFNFFFTRLHEETTYLYDRLTSSNQIKPESP